MKAVWIKIQRNKNTRYFLKSYEIFSVSLDPIYVKRSQKVPLDRWRNHVLKFTNFSFIVECMQLIRIDWQETKSANIFKPRVVIISFLRFIMSGLNAL